MSYFMNEGRLRSKGGQLVAAMMTHRAGFHIHYRAELNTDRGTYLWDISRLFIPPNPSFLEHDNNSIYDYMWL